MIIAEYLADKDYFTLHKTWWRTKRSQKHGTKLMLFVCWMCKQAIVSCMWHIRSNILCCTLSFWVTKKKNNNCMFKIDPSLYNVSKTSCFRRKYITRRNYSFSGTFHNKNQQTRKFHLKLSGGTSCWSMTLCMEEQASYAQAVAPVVYQQWAKVAP